MKIQRVRFNREILVQGVKKLQKRKHKATEESGIGMHTSFGGKFGEENLLFEIYFSKLRIELVNCIKPSHKLKISSKERRERGTAIKIK